MSATNPQTSASQDPQTEARNQKITTFLWFNDNAEEAANFYCSVFKNAKILNTTHYGDAGPGPKGSVMTVDFELDGQRFTGLNGGPQYKFTEAISLLVHCKTQEEIDYYWEKLSEGGAQVACGWLKDKFGLSWQITPDILLELIGDPDEQKQQRAFKAMMTMTKIDIKQLEDAARG
jgi:predicted 3-demethylubiquinone-9 3-methyltransferase (glyoxalase superfamily)